MKQRALQWNVIQDDGGQALTEFVIVIPIVLLMFFAMLQYVVIVRASQLVNYAAYVAARSYAVHASVDGEKDATSTASDAAALALAPVANLVPGEIMGKTVPVLSWAPLRLGEGFIVARYVRLNSMFGGNITITTDGTPKQVHVEINYPQPVYIPGLSEMWGFVGGGTIGKGSDIHQDLRSLQEGLGGVVGSPLVTQQQVSEKIQSWISQAAPRWFNKLFGDREQAISNLIGGFAGDVVDAVKNTVLPFPYISLRGKCSMGYEDWGGSDEYRPRMPHEGGSESTDPEFQKKLDEMQAASDDAKKAQDNMLKKQKELHDAEQAVKDAQAQVDAAQQAYNSADKDHKAAALAKLNQAKAQLAQAQARRDAAKSAFDQAQAEANASQENLEKLTTSGI